MGRGQRATSSRSIRPAVGRWAEEAGSRLDRHTILLHETLLFRFRLQVALGEPGSNEAPRGIWQCRDCVRAPGRHLCVGARRSVARSEPLLHCDAGYSPGRHCVEIRVLQKHLQYQQWLSRVWRDGHGVLRRPFGLHCGSTGFVSSLAAPGGGKSSRHSQRGLMCCQRYFLATGLFCVYLSGNLPVPAARNITVIAKSFN